MTPERPPRTAHRRGRRAATPGWLAAAALLLALVPARPAWSAAGVGLAAAAPCVCVAGPASAGAALARALAARLPGARVLAPGAAPDDAAGGGCGWRVTLAAPTPSTWALSVEGPGGAAWQRELRTPGRAAPTARARAAAVWVADLVAWAALAPPAPAAPAAAPPRRLAGTDGARRERAAAEPVPPDAGPRPGRLAVGLAGAAGGGAGEGAAAAGVTGGLLLRAEGGAPAGLQGVLRLDWGRAAPAGGYPLDVFGVAAGPGWRIPLGAPLALTADVHALAAAWTARGDRRRAGWRFGGGLGLGLTWEVAPRLGLFADAAVDGLSPPVAFHGSAGGAERFRLGRWAWRAGLGVSVELM